MNLPDLLLQPRMHAYAQGAIASCIHFVTYHMEWDFQTITHLFGREGEAFSNNVLHSTIKNEVLH